MLLSIFYFIIGDNIYNIYSILIIFTIFLCDSTYTLKARFITHLFSSKHQSIYKRIYESLSILSSPHKTHLYQKLAQKFISHRRVNLYLMSYNIFWCFSASTNKFKICRIFNFNAYFKLYSLYHMVL